MKKSNVILTVTVMFLLAIVLSCEKDNSLSSSTLTESESNDDSSEKIINQCFLVRGPKGELIDLHILRDNKNHTFITTSLSQSKSEDEDVPEYIVIADDVEFFENSFILPETEENYFIFEVTLGDPETPKAPPGGGTISADCNCLAPSGSCTVTYTVINGNVFTAHCFNSVDAPCNMSGVGQCQWTLPEIIIKKGVVESQKTTTVIVESDVMDYNGLLYE